MITDCLQLWVILTFLHDDDFNDPAPGHKWGNVTTLGEKHPIKHSWKIEAPYCIFLKLYFPKLYFVCSVIAAVLVLVLSS